MFIRVSKLLAAVFAFALMGVFAAGCAGQPASEAGSNSSAETGAPGSSSAEASAASGGGAAGAVDLSALKTVADVKALSENFGYSYNDDYLVCVSDPEGSLVRGVAKITPEVQKQIEEINPDMQDLPERQEAIYEQLVLESVEDLTSGILTQDQMGQLVGKTGQDLYDEGYTFYAYFMYGGDQTIAQLENGYYLYDVTFNVKTPESASEDGGASVKGATVTEVQYVGASNQAMDPELV